jgi:hypothetical protein
LTRATAVLYAAALAVSAAELATAADSERWNDDKLVASYRDLEARGGLDAAIRTPVLPSDPPEPAFLESLAWFAAGSPDKKGELSQARLDSFLEGQAAAYKKLLQAKVERGEDNDFVRTRTWKLVQKLTLLRDEMSRPPRAGSYPYAAMPKAPSGYDAWEREHTLRSADDFAEKVCRASSERPVLVKFGNTNCTQCMLFEMIGSVKAFAQNPAHKDVAVYKVWWGFKPDVSFAGRIKDPERLDELVKGEGVRSSPTFAVYRNGRRYTCGGGFPDPDGGEQHLDSCIRQRFGEAPMATACAPKATSRLGEP